MTPNRYYVSILPGGEASAQPLEQLGTFTGTSTTWSVSFSSSLSHHQQFSFALDWPNDDVKNDNEICFSLSLVIEKSRSQNLDIRTRDYENKELRIAQATVSLTLYFFILRAGWSTLLLVALSHLRSKMVRGRYHFAQI